MSPAARVWRFRFALGLLALSVCKLWLVRGEGIYGSATWFDALWNLRSARGWYWGEPYSWAAFIRPPAYPLWLALVHALGIPLRIAAEFWQLLGYLIFVVALRRAGVASSICLTSYALAIFHPASFEMSGYTLADTFYAAVLPMVLGGCILVWCTRSKLHALWSGFAFAVLWDTREESVLVAIIIATWIALALFIGRRGSLFPSALALVTALVFIAAVYAANQRTFGAFARSAMSARDFVSAYEALLSIKPPETKRFVPVTRATRMRAYEISPTFAKLKPQLEGPIGERWETNTMRSYGIEGEISAALMVWALRDAANAIGEHATPSRANHFYRRIAREIRKAERAGEISSRLVWAGPMDPAALESARFLPHSIGRMMQSFVLYHRPLPVREDALLSADERQLYQEMTARAPNESWPPRENPASSLRSWIGWNYRDAVMILSLVAALAVLSAPFYWRRLHFRDPAFAIIALLLVTITSRVLLFAVLDATSWPSNQLRYLYPVLPLYSILLVLILDRGARAWKTNGAVSVAAAAPRKLQSIE